MLVEFVCTQLHASLAPPTGPIHPHATTSGIVTGALPQALSVNDSRMRLNDRLKGLIIGRLLLGRKHSTRGLYLV